MSALFYALPALLLLGALLFGRYPGERLLLAAAARTRRRLARSRRAAPRPGRLHPAPIPRGSALIAAALAGRAPPRSHRRRDENRSISAGIVPSAHVTIVNCAYEGAS